MPAESDATDMRTDEAMTTDERRVALQVLESEYRTLMAALAAAWSASLTRMTIFLGVVSAAGVALGFAAQAGIDTSSFRTIALLVLPLLMFMGGATFIRLVQIQREAVGYSLGMNRIRHFFQQAAPKARPYFVLTAHDDAAALYSSVGTGMSRRPPRIRLLYLVVQTQGIVGVITAAVVGAFSALGTATLGFPGWVTAAGAFVLTLVVLFAYWQRSIDQLLRSLRPINPTPPTEGAGPS